MHNVIGLDGQHFKNSFLINYSYNLFKSGKINWNTNQIIDGHFCVSCPLNLSGWLVVNISNRPLKEAKATVRSSCLTDLLPPISRFLGLRYTLSPLPAYLPTIHGLAGTTRLILVYAINQSRDKAYARRKLIFIKQRSVNNFFLVISLSENI